MREEHRALHGITLPPSDPFWDTHYPPNGWNCRCRVVQVRKSKNAPTPQSEVQTRVAENERNQRNRKADMFRFNSGKQRKTLPDYNPYTIRRCNDCDLAKGKMSLAFVPSNEACKGCRIVRELADADKKQTKKLAKPLQGSTIIHPNFEHPIKITRNSINEWTNQPFKYINEKNLMLLDIQKELEKSVYIGVADNHKGVKRVVQSHILETKVRDIKAFIIVREYDWGDYVLHSLSDAQDFDKHVTKNSERSNLPVLQTGAELLTLL